MAYLPAQQNDEASHAYVVRSLSSIRYRTKKEFDLYKKGTGNGHYHRLQVYVDQKKRDSDRFGEQSIVCLAKSPCSLSKKDIGDEERDLLRSLDPLYLEYQSAKKSFNTAIDRLNGDKKGAPSTVAKNPSVYWNGKDTYLAAKKKFYDAYVDSQDRLAEFFQQTNGYSITQLDINTRNEALERPALKELRVPEPVRLIAGRKRKAPDLREEDEDVQAIPPKARRTMKIHSPQPYPGPQHEPLTPPPTSDFDIPVTNGDHADREEGGEDNETGATSSNNVEKSEAEDSDNEVVITGEGKAVEVDIDVGDGESITFVGEPRRRRKGKGKARAVVN